MTSSFDKSHKSQNLKKKFYDFKNIYKIEDFFCFSDNNSYITLNGSRTKNKTKFEAFNTNEILMNFRKNISSYLIVKKHYESNSNKYFSLISKLKYFNDKKKNLSYSQNLLNDENLYLNEDHKMEKKGEIKEENKQLPLDYESYSNLKNSNENFIKCQFIIEDERFQKQVSKKMSLAQLERKFVKKYENNWQDAGQSKENIVEKLTKDFEDLLQKINTKAFFIKLPKNLKPSMQDFNDFYFFKEDEQHNEQKDHNSEIINIESKENEDTQFQKNKDLDDLLIDQMINSLNNYDKQAKIENNMEIDKNFILNLPNQQESERNKNKTLDNNESKKPENEEIKEDNNIIENKIEEKEKMVLEFIEKNSKEEILKNDSKADQENEKIKEDFIDSEQILLKKSKEENEAFVNEEDNNSFPISENHSRMALIEKLLNSKNIFNEDLSEMRAEHFNYPKIPEDLKFSDENEKEIFQKIFYWLYEVELQVEKDKNDIQNYERDYQMKFLDFLSLEKDPDENSKSSHGPSSSEEEEDEYDDENDSEEG